MLIEIVSNSWSFGHDQYAKLLALQLSSLYVHHPSKADLRITLFVCEDDIEIVEVVQFFEQYAHFRDLCVVTMPLNYVMRRAIGRNMVANDTDADLVWFADCDYLFMDGCIDALADLFNAGRVGDLSYPKNAFYSKTHKAGDDLFNKVNLRELTLDECCKLDRKEFIAESLSRAIGGAQICKNKPLKKKGYLRGTKWVQPMVEGEGANFRDDVMFRKDFGCDRGIAIPLGGVYRVRHSVNTYEVEES